MYRPRRNLRAVCFRGRAGAHGTRCCDPEPPVEKSTATPHCGSSARYATSCFSLRHEPGCVAVSEPWELAASPGGAIAALSISPLPKNWLTRSENPRKRRKPPAESFAGGFSLSNLPFHVNLRLMETSHPLCCVSREKRASSSPAAGVLPGSGLSRSRSELTRVGFCRVPGETVDLWQCNSGFRLSRRILPILKSRTGRSQRKLNCALFVKFSLN